MITVKSSDIPAAYQHSHSLSTFPQPFDIPAVYPHSRSLSLFIIPEKEQDISVKKTGPQSSQTLR